MKALKGFSSDRRLEELGSDSGVLKIVHITHLAHGNTI